MVRTSPSALADNQLLFATLTKLMASAFPCLTEFHRIKTSIIYNTIVSIVVARTECSWRNPELCNCKLYLFPLTFELLKTSFFS